MAGIYLQHVHTWIFEYIWVGLKHNKTFSFHKYKDMCTAVSSRCQYGKLILKQYHCKWMDGPITKYVLYIKINKKKAALSADLKLPGPPFTSTV